MASLILRRLSSQNPKPNVHLFSTSQTPDPKPSLSSRMSFVFDQIDAIQKHQSESDHTLQRIRQWRESKHKKPEPEPQSEPQTQPESSEVKTRDGLVAKEVELVHPWPEWIELMERLVGQNYFDHKRRDEDLMVHNAGFHMGQVLEEGFDFTRDWKTVQTASLNFGKDRFDIFRSLSRCDIQLLVGYGCPSVDKKVVFSAKLLRKHVHLDEGDVCSSCSLRSSCERAYLITNKEDEARTIDIMRVLLVYGFDLINGSVANKSLLKEKSVKTVVRKLLHEIVKLSAIPIDPNLPPPVFKKPPPKVKIPPPPPRKRVGRDDIEMKKGDWLCPKCDFMNFAKNTVCLQCDGKRPKRELLPGEWECPECNFLNYRRNMACFHCEHKRPIDTFMENQTEERQHGPNRRSDKFPDRKDVSNAWNFDFDDNESDGADVAAFEFADSVGSDEDSPSGSQIQGGTSRNSDESLHKPKRVSKEYEREYSDHDRRKPGTGFDDFDDEEDDIDSYELDDQTASPLRRSNSNDFSDVEAFSDEEYNSRSYDNRSKPLRQKPSFSGSDDDDLSVHPNWKSSHVADSRQMRGRSSFRGNKESGLGSGSDEDIDEGFRSGGRGSKWGSSTRGFRRGNSDNESDDDDYRGRNGPRGNRGGTSRRGGFKDRGDFDFVEKSSFDQSSQGSRGNGRGFRGDSSRDFNGQRRAGGFGNRQQGRDNAYGNSSRDFNGQRRGGGFGNRQQGRDNAYGNRRSNMDMDFDNERPRNARRVIER